jgi:F-type H+-transporting ATPase subunit gamma
MAGIRELRGRIKSVGNIKQITRAMEMVATTKLRRFQDRAVASRPYAEEITALVGRLSGVLGEEVGEMPLFREGAGSKVAMLLVSSDRGLCGAYNSNAFRVLEAWVRASGLAKDQIDFFVYGRRGYQYLSKRGYNVARFIVDPPLEEIDFNNAATTTKAVIDAFLSGEYREAKILFTTFKSMVRYEPEVVPFLPISATTLAPTGRTEEEAEDEAENLSGDIILEPDAEAIFESLVPRYLETRVYSALLESLTSEYASRRFSMKNATDAASDMQAALKMVYNRKRQEGITMDLLDIVGGVEAQR